MDQSSPSPDPRKPPASEVADIVKPFGRDEQLERWTTGLIAQRDAFLARQRRQRTVVFFR